MATDPDINDLKAFVAVAEAGGFTAAADRLGVAKSRVSQKVSRLEASLGVSLFSRTTRRINTTPEGEFVYGRCGPLLSELTEVLEEVGQAKTGLRGPLRLSVPMELAVQSLAPLVRRFMIVYPGVQLELRSSDHIIDPVQEGIDLSFRLGWLKESRQKAVKLRDFEQVVVASPDYLARAGMPQTPVDLANHDWIALSLLPAPLTWSFVHQDGREERVQVRGQCKTDATTLLRALLREGMGISVLHELYAAPDLSAGALVRLLPEWHLPRVGLYAVYPPGRFVSPRARALVEFCRSELAGF
ncbi:LysR family transcriptional regulator [Halomonas organivorans]|uniref:DNA-binding transcriptional LysR family regulator n=1 Tax=Halomonas organivorans TaxID=257772 RepID=A0A7W5G4D8_9GAMM|nr:LysR family transcriptional regulator [Halomonas organivorans]MBB3139862.1 DNA-binding transcriptional LysR family regulator [Halomonas organivorans]